MTQTETNTNDADGYDAEGYNADELGQYRSLSTLAVIAFVLGLCSVIMFVSPLMVFVPLAAVATSLLALKGIVASAGGFSGARLARWGLALAILFGVASLARVKVRDLILQRQADRVGQQWLSLAAEGRSEDLLQLMTKAAVDKLTPAVEPGQSMPFFGGILASALMRQDPLVVSLMKSREGGESRHQLQDASIDAAGIPPQAVFRYVASNADSEPLQCLMVLKRFRASNLETIWLVDSWKLE